MPASSETPSWWWRPREAIIALFLLSALAVTQITPSTSQVWSSTKAVYGDDGDDRTNSASSLAYGGGCY